jgi:hypothetical protein
VRPPLGREGHARFRKGPVKARQVGAVRIELPQQHLQQVGAGFRRHALHHAGQHARPGNPLPHGRWPGGEEQEFVGRDHVKRVAVGQRQTGLGLIRDHIGGGDERGPVLRREQHLRVVAAVLADEIRWREQRRQPDLHVAAHLEVRHGQRHRLDRVDDAEGARQHRDQRGRVGCHRDQVGGRDPPGSTGEQIRAEPAKPEHQRPRYCCAMLGVGIAPYPQRSGEDGGWGDASA